MRRIYYPPSNYALTLEPIMEEEGNDTESNMAVITSACTSDRFGLSPSEPERERTLPQNMHMRNKSDDAVLPHLKWECGAEDLLERIAWYQTEYEELREFARNEKQVYEEFFSDQLSEANKKIRELEDKNERLEAELNKSEDKCKDVMSTLILLDKSVTRHDDSKKIEDLEKELKLLRMKLVESERRRNDSEMRCELTESNFRNQYEDLKQCLEEVRTALSNAKEVNVCHHCNGHTNDVTRCEEKNEDGFRAEVIELKQEIDTLKQENVKLSEDMNKKIAKLRETEATKSLLLDHICKMENEKLKLSESLEGSFEVIRSLNSELSKIKKENDEMCNKNATISRSLEGKYEESGKRSSENSRLEKEDVAFSDEITNLQKMLEDTIMEIAERRLKYSRELKMKTDQELSKNRIVQLELQAHNGDDMHHIYYLESLVASLKNENVILQTHLGRVQRQMETVVSPAKVRNRCGQLKQKHMAVQTSISSNDFCQMMGSDSDVIQDYGLPKVHVKIHSMENQNSSSLYPSKHLGERVICHIKCTYSN